MGRTVAPSSRRWSVSSLAEWQRAAARFGYLLGRGRFGVTLKPPIRRRTIGIQTAAPTAWSRTISRRTMLPAAAMNPGTTNGPSMPSVSRPIPVRETSAPRTTGSNGCATCRPGRPEASGTTAIGPPPKTPSDGSGATLGAVDAKASIDGVGLADPRGSEGAAVSSGSGAGVAPAGVGVGAGVGTGVGLGVGLGVVLGVGRGVGTARA